LLDSSATNSVAKRLILLDDASWQVRYSGEPHQESMISKKFGTIYTTDTSLSTTFCTIKSIKFQCPRWFLHHKNNSFLLLPVRIVFF
jgi:hypothetical protein